MAVSVYGFSLAGYEGYGTIKVMYNILSGKQVKATRLDCLASFMFIFTVILLQWQVL